MYKTLKLVDGDIVFNSLGKLSFIENEESIIQTVNIRLKTLKGELFYNEEFGIEELNSFKATDNNIAKLESSFRNTLVDGEKITDVFVNNIKKVETGVYYISLEIIANNDTISTNIKLEV